MPSGLKQRIYTALIIAVPILFMVFFNDYTRVGFLSALIILIGWEYLSILKTTSMLKILYSVISFSLIYLALNVPVLSEIILVLGAIVCCLYLIDLFITDFPILRSRTGIMSIFYICIPILTALLTFNTGYFRELVIGSLILIWVSDIGAYFVGKSIGKRKLMPTVSPGKSWEGFYGAGMCVLLATYLFYSIMGVFSFQTWILIGLAVWLFGSMGDLVESKFKRKIKIKDSGSILPGHGGFLDRFDGYFFCLPFVSLVIKLTH